MNLLTRRSFMTGLIATAPLVATTYGCNPAPPLKALLRLASFLTSQKIDNPFGFLVREARDFAVQSLVTNVVEYGWEWMRDTVLVDQARKLGVSEEVYVKTARIVGDEGLSKAIQDGYAIWYASHKDKHISVKNTMAIEIYNTSNRENSGSFTFHCVDTATGDINFSHTTQGAIIQPNGVYSESIFAAHIYQAGQKTFKIVDEPLHKDFMLIVPPVLVLNAVVLRA